MHVNKVDSIWKSISLGLGFCLVISFLFFLFQGPTLSSVFISYLLIILVVIQYVRKKKFDIQFYIVYLAALLFQGLILSYNYFFKNIQFDTILFYSYTIIFFLQIGIYSVSIYYGKLSQKKGLK
jgi:CDP-diglyceride synthetase